ncbi:non-ribosomal peptide synthetase [Aquimarina intermedia]|uniref:Amino acid adenylation domain-containing protein n=1 Tax=Aquimarina intermedia TaxID=350814 RepID=A0A5S5C5E2_9FLAO|nr:non-ribosomal peptide synthetase [Aquimarina intermedia]TYP74359.1 amino acid adenylation domain-containing protein [Aquimarina intermedia]
MLDKKNIKDIINLNATQKGMLFHYLRDEYNNSYNTQLHFIFEENVSVPFLKKAFLNVQLNNDILRSVFRWENISNPIQIILKEIPLNFEYIHALTNKKQVETIKNSDWLKRFDLKQVPLRITVIEETKNRYHLLITHHHILYDGWSTGIFLKEFFDVYSKLTQGFQIKSHSKINYSTAYKLYNQHLNSEVEQNFWKRYLTGFEPVNITQYLVRNESDKNDLHHKVLSRSSMQTLEQFAIQESVTKASIIYAVLGIVFSKCFSVTDFSFGTTVSTRSIANNGLDEVMGVFINTLPLRMQEIDKISVLELVHQTHQHLLERNEFNTIPYAQLKEMKQLGPSKDLFDIVVAVENYPLDKSILNLDTQITLDSVRESIDSPLLISVFFKETLDIEFTFDASKISTFGIENLKMCVTTMLTKLFENSTTHIGDISLATPEFLKQIDDLNAQSTQHPHESIVTIINERVREYPNKIALSNNGKKITYQQFNETANKIARLLIKQGVVENDIVGILAERSENLIIYMLAILKTGAAYLPIDPQYPKKRIDYIVENSKLSLLISENELKNICSDLSVKVIQVDFNGTLFRNANSDNLDIPIKSDKAAYVIYTSGSTGNPKGCVVLHKNLTNLYYGFLDVTGYSAQDVISCITTVSFDIFLTETIIPLSIGMSVVLVSSEDQKNPEKIAEIIIEEGVNIFQGTPSHFRILLDSEVFNLALTRLRSILLGGETFPKEILSILRNTYQGKIFNAYGPSETTVWSTVKEISKDSSISIGTPLVNTQLYVLDSNLNKTPFGFPGELYIGGDGVCNGYLYNEELSSQRFIVLKNSKDPVYRTGDLVKYLPNGDLKFLGRVDNQVKLRGYRIELGEIETKILSCYPYIKQTKVLVDESGNFKDLVAYVVASKMVDIEALRNEIKGSLPDYMVPAKILQLPEFPLTPNGKIDTKRFPKFNDESDTVKELIAPNNLVQEKLMGVWEEILSISEKDISITDNFFEIGGNSLKAMVLQNRIRKIFNVKIILNQILKSPTIAGLSDCIELNETQAYVPIKPSPKMLRYELSPAQKRLYLLQRIHQKSVSYNMLYVAKINGNLNIEKVVAAFKELIKTHAALRTSFRMVNGALYQKINEHVSFDLELISRKSSMNEAFDSFLRPFNLEQAPLIRAAIYKNDEEDLSYLLVDLHHIIADGVSQGILIENFSKFYNGQSITKPQIEYVDYVSWLSKSLAHNTTASKKFWHEQLKDINSLSDLPIDFKRTAERQELGDVVKHKLSVDTTNTLNTIALANHTTPYVLLFTVLNILLQKLYNDSQISVGTTTSGREHADLEGVVGMFVNTLVITNKIPSEVSFTTLLKMVQEKISVCFEHQSYPYENLINELEVNRENSRNPLFDVMYTYQNFEQNALELENLQIQEMESYNKISKFDLTLRVSEIHGSLNLEFEYAEALFKRETIEKYSNYFVNILHCVLEEPDTLVSKVKLLSDKEFIAIYNEFDNTDIKYPEQETIVSLFSNQVIANPNKVALKIGDEQLTYSELDEEINKLSMYLLESGVKSETIVGLFVDRSMHTIIGMLAILRCGAAYLPIDVDHPISRIKFMLEDSKCTYLLTTKNCIVPDNYNKKVLFFEDAQEHPTQAASDFNMVSPSSLCYIIYTSGTTGKPKGVMIEHKNVVRLFFNDSTNFNFNEQDVWTLFHSPCFDFSVWEIYGALLFGGTLIIVPKDTTKDTRLFIDLLHKEKVTILNQTPSAFYQLSYYSASEIDKKTKLYLRHVIFGGEALQPKKLKAWKKLYPEVQLINMFGITETTVHVTYKEITSKEIDNGKSNIGVPISTLSMYVLDSDLNRNPPGITGELYVGGSGVARGYLGNEELTKKKFIDNPFKPGSKMYKTGDLGRILWNGDIEYLGRLDNQIQLRGYRIELDEIEKVLQEYSLIKDAVVAVKSFTNDDVICAYYIADKKINNKDFRSFLLEFLPDYMLPSFFIRVASFPLTNNGKLEKKLLPDPSIKRSVDDLPKNEIHKKLIKIWADILAVPEYEIGIYMNFFEIGGDSLKVVQISERIKKEFNKEISVAKIFSYPIIADLSEYLSTSKNPVSFSSTDTGDDVEQISNVIDLLNNLN